MIPTAIENMGGNFPSPITIAKQLDGLRVADAINILDTAREYVLQASMTLTSQIETK